MERQSTLPAHRRQPFEHFSEEKRPGGSVTGTLYQVEDLQAKQSNSLWK
jgi:hypothetical protein